MRRSKRMKPILLALLCVLPLGADVTIRYKTEVRLNPSLPPQIAGPASAGLAAASGTEQTVRMKGTRGYSGFGGLTFLTDLAKGEITVIDSANHQFATVPAGEFTDAFARAIPPMPTAARESMAALKSSAESRATGRTDVIQGVEVEEREVTLTIESPAAPSMPSASGMKMVMQVWTAKPAEALRIQALRELTAYNLWTYATMNPAAGMKKMFDQMPGFGGGMSAIFEEMSKGKSTVLRIHSDLYIPGIAAMLARRPQQDSGASAPPLDPNAPFFQMNQEAVEISSAPIPDAVFQIPEGFEAAPLDTIVGRMMSRAGAAGGQ